MSSCTADRLTDVRRGRVPGKGGTGGGWGGVTGGCCCVSVRCLAANHGPGPHDHLMPRHTEWCEPTDFSGYVRFFSFFFVLETTVCIPQRRPGQPIGAHGAEKHAQARPLTLLQDRVELRRRGRRVRRAIDQPPSACIPCPPSGY